MSFTEAIRAVLAKYAEFGGYATRPEFWWWVLFTALVAAACQVIDPVSAGGASLGAVLSGLWTVAIFLPTLAVLVRRLRDAGLGWAHAFWALVPVVGLVIVGVLCAQPSRPPSAGAQDS